MKKLLTRQEICELLCVADSTLRRMMREGRFIPSVNGRGRKLLFDPDAVEAWIKTQQSSATRTAVTCPIRSEKQKARDFAERQRLADLSLERHRKNRRAKHN